MLVRIDLLYPHLVHIGSGWPPAPSTFFQAVVSYNGHNLDEVSDVLESLEAGSCVRVVTHSDSIPINVTTYVPVLPKKKVKGFQFGDPENKTEKDVRIFPLEGDKEIHLSYYFDLPREFTRDRLIDVLQVTALGRGPSASFVKNISIVNNLPTTESGTIWELEDPKQMYPGFLRNLRLLYDARKSSRQAQPKAAKFVSRDGIQRRPYALFELTKVVDMELASHVVAWIRHAAMKNARGDVARAASGHYPERLTIVPVPTLSFNENRIHRIIVTSENAGLVKTASYELAGLNLVGDEGRDAGSLVAAEYDSVFSQFLHPSRRWIAVTPILVSGYDDHDVQKRRKLLAKMFRHAGLPQPVAVNEFQSNARKFVVEGKHGYDKLGRMLCAIEFKEEVSGVVAVGTGRYSGMGVFANLNWSVTFPAFGRAALKQRVADLPRNVVRFVTFPAFGRAALKR